MKHPTIGSLALFAGGELAWWVRLPIQRHLAKCRQCQGEVTEFRAAAESVRCETAEMPAGIHWERMAAEMRANIRLGLEASEAISAYSTGIADRPRPQVSWRMAAVAASIVVLMIAGYWLNAVRKSEEMALMRGPEPIVVEVSDRGVGMSDGNQGMELRGPHSNRRAAIMTVSTEGSAGAQYVDEETGQITVNHVYME